MNLYAIIPILTSADTAVSAAFYQQLGFHVNANYEGYLTLGIEEVELHIMQHEAEVREPRSVYCRVRGVDAWYEKAKALGAQYVLGEPKDMPYRIREFSIRDPHGNVLHLGENIE